jgi:hypothetical protein
MSAIRIIKDCWGLRAGLVILIATLISLPMFAEDGLARKRHGCRGDRVVAHVDIDSDGFVIRTEVLEDGDAETVDIILNGDLIGAIAHGELRCLRQAGVFDINDCDDDDIVRWGKDIHIRAGRKVRGSVVALGGSVYVEGRVYGDVVAIGGSVTLDDGSQVKGDAVVLGGDLELLDGCYVRGDAVAVGGNIEDEDGARIGGDVVSMDFSIW